MEATEATFIAILVSKTGKTRYMIFNMNTGETKLVKINDEYIQRVHDAGKESSFKLVGIQIDDKLKWTEHINYICKNLTYGLPMWGFAKKGRLNICLLYTSPSPRDS